VLPVYAVHKSTALIVDIGSVTQIVPFYDGHVIFDAAKRADIGGDDVTDALVSSLNHNNLRFQFSTAMHQSVEQWKKEHCYIALDYVEEMKKCQTTKENVVDCSLTDGTSVTLNHERILAGEILFQPSLHGLEIPGIHQLIYNSIMSCDIHLRRQLFGNIILSGGGTMMKGFKERLQKELTSLVFPGVKVNIIAEEERIFHVFKGAHHLLQIPDFSKMWMMKWEYDEYGPWRSHTRCSYGVVNGN